MWNGLTRLITALRTRPSMQGDAVPETTGITGRTEIERAYLFTDLMAASAHLDVGAFVNEFQMRADRLAQQADGAREV